MRGHPLQAGLIAIKVQRHQTHRRFRNAKLRFLLRFLIRRWHVDQLCYGVVDGDGNTTPLDLFFIHSFRFQFVLGLVGAGNVGQDLESQS